MTIRILLLTLALILSSCASYEPHVAARQIGVAGEYNGETKDAGGKVVYRVEYR